MILLLAPIGCSRLSIYAPPTPAPVKPAASAPDASTHHAGDPAVDNGKTDCPVPPDDLPPVASPESDPLLMSTPDEEAGAGDNAGSASETAAGETAPAERENPAAKSPFTIFDEALDFCQAAQEFWQAGELENALEALDKAYSLILDVDTENNPKAIQQKEDLRFLISKRILEIYASRHIVVNGNHQAIPMVMNHYVEAEIKRFTNGERRFFIDAYRRSGRYRPMITKIMKEAGLPVELSWLPLIESGFKVHALSRARALGLWQFISSTGYKFGLRRTVYIDERMDFVKSTKAAVEYLKELHQIFGDWTTALAAYNCGEGRVLRVIRTQNVNYLDNFWDLYERLPLETARYVPRFLAILHILKDPAKYGFDNLVADPPLAYDVVKVNRRVHLKHIAEAVGCHEDSLRLLNPELRYRILPEEPYDLRVPVGSGDTLLAAIDTLPLSSKPQRPFVYHRIRRGESLSTIAEKYHTSVRAIMRTNRLRRSNYIVAGRKLKIPLRGGKTTYVASAPVNRCPSPGKEQQYTVRSGDSLWILAKRFETTTKEIQQLNGLPDTTLRIGQTLQIPACKSEAVDTSGMKTYLVRRGDSPFAIAKKHNMPLNEFLKANRLTPRSKIFPGQQVLVE